MRRRRRNPGSAPLSYWQTWAVGAGLALSALGIVWGLKNMPARRTLAP